MADPLKRTPANAPGRFFVTTNCTFCGVCRVIAPEHFAEGEPEFKTLAYIRIQPTTPEAISRCREALAACPCDAIGDSGA